MGAAPSILTVPSGNIIRDIECLKAICPSRFHVEQKDDADTGVETATLTDKNGPLILVLVEIPVAAVNRVASNRITFVLQESELQSVAHRCEQYRLITKIKTRGKQQQQSSSFAGNNKSKENGVVMAEVNLPGGAGFALVSPGMVKNVASRHDLSKQLAQSMISSLPKGVLQSSSSRPSSPKKSSRTIKRTSLDTSSNNDLFTIHKSPLLSPEMIDFQERYKQQQQDYRNKSGHPIFPSLKLSALHLHGKYKHDFMANSTIPVKIETELFIGHVIFLIRPEVPSMEDPFWDGRVFSIKGSRVFMQVQGKFKYEPKGPLYAGLEASSDLQQMGRLSKGLSGLLLKLAKTSNQHVYHSFGDDKEKAKVTVPAHTFFDHIVVTPTGTPPPSILEPLQERPESIEYRKRQKPTDIQATKGAQWVWNLSDTYSMSYSTKNLDILNWTLLDVPQMGNVGLRALFGDSALRFVMYEYLTPVESNSMGVCTRHLQQYLRYAYVVQCKHKGFNGSTDDDDDESRLAKKDQQNRNENDTVLDWVRHQFQCSTKEAIASEPAPNQKDQEQLSKSALNESDKFRKQEMIEGSQDYICFLQEEQYDAQILNRPDPRPTLTNDVFERLATIDALCPAYIEMWASQGKYTRAYAFNVNDRTVFRTPRSFCDLVRAGKYLKEDVSDATIDILCSPRASEAERTRRLLATMLEGAMAGKKAHLLLKMMEQYSCQFLRRREPPSLPEKIASSSKETSGMVARALSDHHWIEEWTRITKNAITFSHPETRQLHFRINTDCIIAVKCLGKDESPLLHNFYFLAVETLGRVTYLMFIDESDRAKCHCTISMRMKQAQVKRNNARKLPLYLNSPRDEFLRRSSMWKCGERLIINSRKMSFCAPTTTPDQELDPLDVVEDALKKVLSKSIEQDDDKLRAFLDVAANLKKVNANKLKSEEQRLAFFLNLYHVMVAHSALIIGAVDSQQRFVNNFSCVSYQCSDDIFSIMELEHCIIRAKTSRLPPTVVVSSPKPPPKINSRLLKTTSPFRSEPAIKLHFQVPQSKFCFALQNTDYRINFAINVGSMSCPNEIPVYSVEMLEGQLDDACSRYLHSTVTITQQRNKSIMCTLPRICQWYERDFGITNYSILKTLERHLGTEERKIILSQEFPELKIVIKHLPLSFCCRRLELQDEEDLFVMSVLKSSSSESLEDLSTTSSTTGVSQTPIMLSDAPSVKEDNVDDLLEYLMKDELQF